MTDTDNNGTEQILEHLDRRIEKSRESYQRDTNPRHTNIALGKLRAYNTLRQRIVSDDLGLDGGQANE